MFYIDFSVRGHQVDPLPRQQLLSELRRQNPWARCRPKIGQYLITNGLHLKPHGSKAISVQDVIQIIEETDEDPVFLKGHGGRRAVIHRVRFSPFGKSVILDHSRFFI